MAWSLPGSFCPWDFPGINTGVGCNLSDSGIELISSALASEFFTSEPPGKTHFINTDKEKNTDNISCYGLDICIFLKIHMWKPYNPTCVHAKPLQSCLTLCNPMDCSPTGSSVHGTLQARILEYLE